MAEEETEKAQPRPGGAWPLGGLSIPVRALAPPRWRFPRGALAAYVFAGSRLAGIVYDDRWTRFKKGISVEGTIMRILVGIVAMFLWWAGGNTIQRSRAAGAFDERRARRAGA